MDIITLAAAKSYSKTYTDSAISGIGGGISYKGAVNYYSNLPNNPSVGDAYTVKYKGSSGTDPDGSEYVWGNYEDTNQWIKLGADSDTLIIVYTKDNQDNITCNQTYQTIKNAIDNGQSITGWIINGTVGGSPTQIRGIALENNIIHSFYGFYGTGVGSIREYEVLHNSSNTVTYSSVVRPVLPSTTSSDNGKIVGVVSGVWNKVEIKTINSQSLIGSGNIETSTITMVSWS